MHGLSSKLCVGLAALTLTAGLAGCSASPGAHSSGVGDNSTLKVTSMEAAEEQTFETVSFGAYENEGVEWLVLDEQDGKKLLISKYVLEAKPFSDVDAGVTWAGTSPRPTFDVQWAESSLRDWLNGDFVEAAFSQEERSAIADTVNGDTKNSVAFLPDSYSAPDDHMAAESTDKVFLLSVDEAKHYFANNAARAAAPTNHALESGVYTGVSSGVVPVSARETGDGNAIWWLRSCGYYGGYTAVVTDDGYVHGAGYRINGELQDGYADHGTEHSSELGGNVGVRPCIWVDASALP